MVPGERAPPPIIRPSPQKDGSGLGPPKTQVPYVFSSLHSSKMWPQPLGLNGGHWPKELSLPKSHRVAPGLSL